MTETKSCRKCGVEKPFAAFHSDKSKKDGLTGKCGACATAAAAKWTAENRARSNLAKGAWRDRNPEKQAAAGKAWRESLPEDFFPNRRLSKYGLTIAAYQEMLTAQENSCAICFTAFSKTPHVDHCHTSGKVRGLACGSCNRALGLMKDSPAVLRSAALYLELHHCTQGAS